MTEKIQKNIHKRVEKNSNIKDQTKTASIKDGTLIDSLIKQKKRNLQVGDVCNLKITALGPNNMGIDEFTYPYTIFVPNAKYGSQIKAKILKINSTITKILPFPYSKGFSGQTLTNNLNVTTLSLQEERGKHQNENKALLLPKKNMFTKTISFAVAQLIEEENRSEQAEVVHPILENIPVKPGDILEVSIKKEMAFQDTNTARPSEGTSPTCAGIVELANKYQLIVPLLSDTPRENLKVIVTRVKDKYAFAKIEGSNLRSKNNKQNNLESLRVPSLGTYKTTLSSTFATNPLATEYDLESARNLASKCLNLDAPKICAGLKFTTTLPTNAPMYGNYLVYKLKNTILFLKPLGNMSFSSAGSQETASAKQPLQLLPRFASEGKDGTQLEGDTSFQVKKVRIKIISTSKNCVIGKILQVNPIPKKQKMALVLKSVRDMINHGLHFGEKAVKCHARMKKYLWIKKQGATKPYNMINNGMFNNAVVFERTDVRTPNLAGKSKSLLNSNSQRSTIPLMKKGRHIINLLKTRRCLNKALKVLTKYALKGRTFLFIGTKKPATDLIARASFFTKNSFYVNTRWLGGMLTNWKTICKSISKIHPILKEKQKVVRDILERRQTIKTQLIQKALLLRKKSKFILTKGRYVLNLLKNTSLVKNSDMITRAHKLISLRNDFNTKGNEFLQKRQRLIQKRREFIYETLLLKEKGFLISNKYKTVLNQLAQYTTKLSEYKYLLTLTTEIQQIKKAYSGTNTEYSSLFLSQSKNVAIGLSEGKDPTETIAEKLTDKKLYSISYGQLKEIQNQLLTLNSTGQQTNSKWIIPNPPKEILNRIVLTMKNQNINKNDENSLLVSKSITSLSINDELQPEKNIDGISKKASDILICSTLLSKFSSYCTYIKTVIQKLLESINLLEKQAAFYECELNKIKTALVSYLDFKQKYIVELQNLKLKLITERNVIRIVKRKLKSLDAQKKLIQFLPRLRYLPTPQTKISQMVQILLSKIVDPKLKYPIEIIYDQKLSTSSKKLAAARKKKWQRLEKYFGGISNMSKLTKTNISRNVAIIVGQNEEINAVRECKKLGIKMFTIVDTNCNPTLSDHIIPANDDSRNAIKYILTKFITRIRLAQKLRMRLQKLKKTN